MEKQTTLATVVPVKLADQFRKVAKKNLRSGAGELRYLISKHVEENK